MQVWTGGAEPPERDQWQLEATPVTGAKSRAASFVTPSLFGALGAPVALTARMRVGRIPAVGLVLGLYREGLVTAQTAGASVGEVWFMSEYPDRHAGHDEWRKLSELAGYTEDGKPAVRRTEPFTLYRGCVPDRKTDWSWTADRDVAVEYAGGSHQFRPIGKVWTATGEPWPLLARYTQRNEHEYVVDTDGLVILADSHWA